MVINVGLFLELNRSSNRTVEPALTVHASQHMSQFSAVSSSIRQPDATRVAGARGVSSSSGSGAGSSSGGRAGSAGLSTWNLLLRIWPIEDRPEEMQDPETVAALTFDQLIKYKKHYEALVKKEGKGDGVFGKDSQIPATMFEAGEDNCADVLHPAR